MLDQYFIKGDKAVFRIIDNEAVILTMDDNTLHILNDVGSRIWELSDGKINLKEIIDLIHNEYDVDYEESKNDCIEFIKELQKKGMLESKDKKHDNKGKN